MSTHRTLCKYFMHGACLKGDSCKFSHDWRDKENNVCTFYQKGLCSYGSRCRYEHVKVRTAHAATQSTRPFSSPRVGSESSQLPSKGLGPTDASGASGALAWSVPSTSPSPPPAQDFEISGSSRTFNDPSEVPICALAAMGKCTDGESCPHLHGDLCATCGKLCLHPFREDEREEHIRQCEHNQKRLEALRYSQDIECSICLECVLFKPTITERKFGLLSGCDHPFCISCIRGWRSNNHPPGMDVDTVVRACPVCRMLSYFVIPSVIWYRNAEEKQEIIESYKAKLNGIDCRHFNFGNGTCPFGTSCFYKHAYRDGRIEETKLRHLGASDGSTVIAKDVRLVEFLASLNIQH